MEETWLPTIVSGALLGVLFWYVRAAINRMRLEVDRLVRRLDRDEREYLTETKHKVICEGNSADLKLHMNDLMNMQRKDFDAKFDKLWDYLKEMREMIQRGNGNGKT